MFFKLLTGSLPFIGKKKPVSACQRPLIHEAYMGKKVKKFISATLFLGADLVISSRLYV